MSKELYKDFLLLAHRGCSAFAEENTEKAFSLARETAKAVEFDIRLMKDGHIVVFHDKDFKRICGDQGLLLETNKADLPLTKGGQNILSLDEALDICDGLIIHMEIKDPAVVDCIPSRAFHENIIFSSFYLPVVQKLSRKHPTLYLIDRLSNLKNFEKSGASFLGASLSLARPLAFRYSGFLEKTYIYTVNTPKKISWLQEKSFAGAYSDSIHKNPIEL